MGNAEGGRTVGYADQGEWIYFEPVSLEGIDELTIRYAAGFEGGMRRRAPRRARTARSSAPRR